MATSTNTWAALALLTNALAWGLAWWPFRELEKLGLHPLWATSIMYGLAVLIVWTWRPHAWRGLVAVPALWWIALGSGLTNVGFNWAVTIGDVVRVVLLFYMMPAWSILLAWLILDEKPTRRSLARVAIALAGVALVLKTPDSPWPWPQSAADWLALMGGFCFALNNAMLRKLREVPSEQRTFAMFLGGALFSALVGSVGTWQGNWSAPPMLGGWGLTLLVGFAAFFLLSNLALQYGAARLKASTTSLVMLNEILIATASSVLLGASQLSTRIVMGGLLIIAAALWAAVDE
ncbi:MAG: DMT family transporter [Brachymonas sp.]|nr:DMT family transporter [Brachymonas sp.]NJS36068.1 DMT family transporter [Brachymonas sp.]